MKQKTQKFLKKSSYWLGIIIFGAILGVSLQITKAAWTEPGTNPPAGNIGAPINTSSVTQVKGGSLGLTGDLIVNSKSMFGTSTIASNLTAHVGGNVGAAAYCNEDGTVCVSPGSLGGEVKKLNCVWYGTTRTTTICPAGKYVAGTYMGVGGGGDDRLEKIYCCDLF